LRVVRKGCVVRFASGIESRVIRVRLGQMVTEFTQELANIGCSYTPCRNVRVVA
jgi:hypothetical protein